MWNDQGTKYSKRRIAVSNQYTSFLANQLLEQNSEIIINSQNFFSQKSIKNFLKTSQKKDVLTHLSEILKTVSLNKLNNLEIACQNKDFSLRIC